MGRKEEQRGKREGEREKERSKEHKPPLTTPAEVPSMPEPSVITIFTSAPQVSCTDISVGVTQNGSDALTGRQCTARSRG